MSGFDSLTLAFEGWFDTPLSELPDALRQRAECELLPIGWEATGTPTATGKAMKEARLTELHQELERMKLQEQQARGDYFPERKELAEGKESSPLPDDYIAGLFHESTSHGGSPCWRLWRQSPATPNALGFQF